MRVTKNTHGTGNLHFNLHALMTRYGGVIFEGGMGDEEEEEEDCLGINQNMLCVLLTTEEGKCLKQFATTFHDDECKE